MSGLDHIYDSFRYREFLNIYTLNKIGSLEGTIQYYYHATPGEP